MSSLQEATLDASFALASTFFHSLRLSLVQALARQMNSGETKKPQAGVATPSASTIKPAARIQSAAGPTASSTPGQGILPGWLLESSTSRAQTVHAASSQDEYATASWSRMLVGVHGERTRAGGEARGKVRRGNPQTKGMPTGKGQAGASSLRGTWDVGRGCLVSARRSTSSRSKMLSAVPVLSKQDG